MIRVALAFYAWLAVNLYLDDHNGIYPPFPLALYFALLFFFLPYFVNRYPEVEDVPGRTRKGN